MCSAPVKCWTGRPPPAVICCKPVLPVANVQGRVWRSTYKKNRALAPANAGYVAINNIAYCCSGPRFWCCWHGYSVVMQVSLRPILHRNPIISMRRLLAVILLLSMAIRVEYTLGSTTLLELLTAGSMLFCSLATPIIIVSL